MHETCLRQVVKAGFNANYGLFTSTEEGGLAFPQPAAVHIESGHALLHFLGLIFGKALYEVRVHLLLGDLPARAQTAIRMHVYQNRCLEAFQGNACVVDM
jgi:hypothetical protein